MSSLGMTSAQAPSCRRTQADQSTFLHSAFPSVAPDRRARTAARHAPLAHAGGLADCWRKHAPLPEIHEPQEGPDRYRKRAIAFSARIRSSRAAHGHILAFDSESRPRPPVTGGIAGRQVTSS